MPLAHKNLFEFGRFRVDTGQRLLFCDGEVVPLAPKAFDTLLALVESQGAVLLKDELLKKVWPDTFVEEGNLTQNISMLRRVLEEGSDGQQYIQTIPKRGYRFVACPDHPRSVPGGSRRLNRASWFHRSLSCRSSI